MDRRTGVDGPCPSETVYWMGRQSGQDGEYYAVTDDRIVIVNPARTEVRGTMRVADIDSMTFAQRPDGGGDLFIHARAFMDKLEDVGIPKIASMMLSIPVPFGYKPLIALRDLDSLLPAYEAIQSRRDALDA